MVGRVLEADIESGSRKSRSKEIQKQVEANIEERAKKASSYLQNYFSGTEEWGSLNVAAPTNRL